MRIPAVLAAVVAAAALCLPACYTAPELDSKEPLDGVKRVFASDLSTAGFAARSRRLASTLGVFAEEPARVAQIPVTASVIAEKAGPRTETMPAALETMAFGEIPPRPLGETLQRTAFPAPHGAGVAEELENVPVLLGLHRRPLGEIDDLRHRADPDDLRPEATFWQRIRRRLRL